MTFPFKIFISNILNGILSAYNYKTSFPIHSNQILVFGKMTNIKSTKKCRANGSYVQLEAAQREIQKIERELESEPTTHRTLKFQSN